MSPKDAYSLIVAAVGKVAPTRACKVTEHAHLIDDGILDSLDIMGFLLEVEERAGQQLAAIDDDFDDFRVSRLVEILAEAH